MMIRQPRDRRIINNADERDVTSMNEHSWLVHKTGKSVY